jgi:hypothetical protein
MSNVVQSALITRAPLARLVRSWRAWRQRVRRGRAALALLLLLALGVFEPLLCVIHCYVWLPLVAQPDAASHQHDHMHMAGAHAAPLAASAGDAALGQPQTLPDGCSLHFGSQSGMPEPPLPQAVHEMILPLLLLAALILLVALRPSTPLTGPPHLFIPVPLRPPIPLVA